MSIRTENLCKKYLIGRVNAGTNGSLRETLANATTNLRLRRRRQSETTEFWALRDISFEIPFGQVVGIIGKNGAGKSTLLKVLSRITEPTHGMFEYTGRMASLLEVGTGFHPELTGRENIFLNGAILGMSQSEIKLKYDEIVAFSEVEQFLETPVKRYSSGMFMRLAFAIAAHLDPEILIIDEVLAVGDAAFQKKCLGRMEALAETGRTVLFVSHNISAIKALCNRVIVLQKGRLVEDTTDVGIAISKYSEAGQGSLSWSRGDEPAPPDAKLIFSNLAITLNGSQPDLRLQITVELISLSKHRPAFIAFDICDSSLTTIMQAVPDPMPFIECTDGQTVLDVEIALPPMIPGVYRIASWVGPHNTVTYDALPALLEFTVESSPDTRRTFPHSRDHGYIVPNSTILSHREKCSA
jgi:lipopolysaccharide transport system ATP-binding protein